MHSGLCGEAPAHRLLYGLTRGQTFAEMSNACSSMSHQTSKQHAVTASIVYLLNLMLTKSAVAAMFDDRTTSAMRALQQMHGHGGARGNFK